MKVALVTGGTGFVGSHLVDALLARGWKVRCTVRRTSNLRWLQGKNIEKTETDLRSGESLDRACEGADVVFHVAGVLTAPSWEKYREGNWLASKNMVEAAVRANVRRFLHVSTLAVAGPSADGTPLEESMQPRPISLYGKSKWKGEQEVRSHAEEIAVTVVRPPVVYGPRDPGLLQMYQGLAKGVRLSVGGRKHVSIVNVRDLVEGMVAAAESKEAEGGVYYLCNEDSWTQEDLMGLVLKVLGRKRSFRISLTDGFVRAVGGLAEWIPGTGMFTRDKALEMTQKYWVCTPARARRDFDFRTAVSPEAGMREAVAWYRENGLLP